MNNDKQIPVYLWPEEAEWLVELLADFQNLDTTEHHDEAQAAVILASVKKAQEGQHD